MTTKNPIMTTTTEDGNMCGIVGYITDEDNHGILRRDKFMRQALIVDTLRGKDSTGVFGVVQRKSEYNEPGWLKALGGGLEFVEAEDYSDFEKSIYKYCVGHNRAATVGDVTVDNAHPFQEGPITLVHNGSLWGTSLLPKSLKECGVDVDSHAICHNLAIAPPEEVIPRLDGAFALVWHDARDDSLNIVRNSERPLHLAQVKNEKTILFMSEAEMLYAVAHRLKIGLEDIVYPLPGQWLKFNSGDISNPEIKRLTLSTRVSYAKPYSAANGYWNYGGGSYNYDHDDYYDDIPFKPDEAATPTEIGRPKEAVRSPIPAAPDDNKVRVGGMLRTIPTRAQELLLELDILVEQRFSFIPVSTSKTEIKGRVVVSGYAGKDGMTAIVYSVNKDTYDRCKERTWTVRPIAVKYMDDNEPAIICKVVSTHDRTARTVPITPIAEELVQGAHGLFVSKAEFAAQVGHGCIQCGRPICSYDAPDLTWVNEGRDPLCSGCANDYVADHGEEGK